MESGIACRPSAWLGTTECLPPEIDGEESNHKWAFNMALRSAHCGFVWRTDVGAYSIPNSSPVQRFALLAQFGALMKLYLLSIMNILDHLPGCSRGASWGWRCRRRRGDRRGASPGCRSARWRARCRSSCWWGQPPGIICSVDRENGIDELWNYLSST